MRRQSQTSTSFRFCVSSSLSLVQSNVNTEKDDNRSDEKDIDCTNNESEFSEALYEFIRLNAYGMQDG